MFWGFLVLWRRPRQRSKDRVAHLNWNSPWHPPTPSQLHSKGQKQVGTRVGLWPNFGWLAKFPDLVAKESIVRDLRVYFVPARRLSLADDWRCTSPSASIQTKWNVTAACPKFIWHSMTGPPCGCQRSNMIPFTCNGEQSWMRQKLSNKQRTSHKGGVKLKPSLWYAEHEVT